MNKVLNNISPYSVHKGQFPVSSSSPETIHQCAIAVKSSGALDLGRDGVVMERGRQFVRIQVHSSHVVYLYPEVNFSLWINFKHTTKYIYYISCLLPC